jgi:hypothetical protein
MLFANGVPKIFRMRITRVQERFATARASEFKAFVHVTVTRNYVIAGTKLLQHPAIEPRQKTKPKRFRMERRENSAASVRGQSDGRIQSRSFGRDATRSPTCAQRDEAKLAYLF